MRPPRLPRPGHAARTPAALALVPSSELPADLPPAHNDDCPCWPCYQRWLDSVTCACGKHFLGCCPLGGPAEDYPTRRTEDA